eukprot:scaffold4034_cov130-Skeletonema_marinoi.AAC.2
MSKQVLAPSIHVRPQVVLDSLFRGAVYFEIALTLAAFEPTIRAIRNLVLQVALTHAAFVATVRAL